MNPTAAAMPRIAPLSLAAALATVLVAGLWTFAQWQIDGRRAPQIGQTAALGAIAKKPAFQFEVIFPPP